MFELRQISGQQRTVRLHRPTASPLAGAEWGVKQRGSVRWPFGSSTGSALYGGSEESPTSFEFRWLTRELVLTRSAELVGVGIITDADELVDLFRSIVRERAPAIVRWRHREALAMLVEFTAEEGMLGEYEPCNLEVQWLEPDSIPEQIVPRTQNAVRDAVRSVLRGYAEVLGTAQIPLTMRREARVEFETSLTEVTNALDDTTLLAKAYVGRSGDSPELIGGVARALAEVGERAQVLIDKSKGSAGSVAQVEGSRELTEAEYLRAVGQRSGMVAWRRATLERITLDGLANGDILAVVMGIEGGDLRVVALKHYGSAEGWQEIAAFNGLSGSTMSAGQLIRVPRRGFFL